MPKSQLTEPRSHRRRVSSSLLLAALLLAFTAVTAHASECVVLLHGLARTSHSMEDLQRTLGEAGYQVVNRNYPSRQYPVAELSDMAITPALEACAPESTRHFVTHSLGGILVRYYLQKHELPQLGRVVMLGPPNQGSEVVDALSEIPGFTWLNGPAGLELGTEAKDIPQQLGQADFSVGIIAGTQSINLILSTMLPNPDDGKVSVASTKLKGMSDHITLPVTHPFMMQDEQVIAQTLHFLRYGHFVHSLQIPHQDPPKGFQAKQSKPQ